MIKDIIKTLGNTNNFHKIISLCEKYEELDIMDYLNYCPQININYEYLNDTMKSDIQSINIRNIESFELVSGEISSDIFMFLTNIKDVKKIKTKYDKNIIEYFITNGHYYLSDEGYSSIEFDLHNIEHTSMVYDNVYRDDYFSIEGVIVEEKIFKNIIRQIKLGKLLGKNLDLKKLMEELTEKEQQKYLKERQEKKKEKDNDGYVDYINAC